MLREMLSESASRRENGITILAEPADDYDAVFREVLNGGIRTENMIAERKETPVKAAMPELPFPAVIRLPIRSHNPTVF